MPLDEGHAAFRDETVCGVERASLRNASKTPWCWDSALGVPA